MSFVGKFSLLEDDNPRNSPFWFTSELLFTLSYATVISFKFLPGARDRFPPGKLIPLYLIVLMIMHGLSALGQIMIVAGIPNAFWYASH